MDGVHVLIIPDSSVLVAVGTLLGVVRWKTL